MANEIVLRRLDNIQLQFRADSEIMSISRDPSEKLIIDLGELLQGGYESAVIQKNTETLSYQCTINKKTLTLLIKIKGKSHSFKVQSEDKSLTHNEHNADEKEATNFNKVMKQISKDIQQNRSMVKMIRGK